MNSSSLCTSYFPQSGQCAVGYTLCQASGGNRVLSTTFINATAASSSPTSVLDTVSSGVYKVAASVDVGSGASVFATVESQPCAGVVLAPLTTLPQTCLSLVLTASAPVGSTSGDATTVTMLVQIPDEVSIIAGNPVQLTGLPGQGSCASTDFDGRGRVVTGTWARLECVCVCVCMWECEWLCKSLPWW